MHLLIKKLNITDVQLQRKGQCNTVGKGHKLSIIIFFLYYSPACRHQSRMHMAD